METVPQTSQALLGYVVEFVVVPIGSYVVLVDVGRSNVTRWAYGEVLSI